MFFRYNSDTLRDRLYVARHIQDFGASASNVVHTVSDGTDQSAAAWLGSLITVLLARSEVVPTPYHSRIYADPANATRTPGHRRSR
ncbi:hypothetical protein J6590_092677 [Homalodisca vitripennis]|nr:hypothetical protein J6590_092677 [Homalodisca vitripennis]